MRAAARTLQAEAWMTRTRTIYDSMAKRFREKRSAKGKITRFGRELPFGCEQFRHWVEQQIGAGCVLCPYCRAPVDYVNFTVDHQTPCARGGGLDFDNLEVICADCNNAKGNLTADEFTKLREHLRILGPAAEADITRRLKSGAMGMRMRWFDRNKKAKPQLAAEPF